MSDVELENNWVEHALSLINKTHRQRSVKYTECNATSSKSHLIYTLKIVKGREIGMIQFVDLAGSERIYKSSSSGDTLKDTLLINKSLSALQDVIGALENKQNHVPFRNSILTRVLQPTLGGFDSKISVILNCSPTEDNINETISTLALGLRLQVVDLGLLIRKNLNCEEIERTLRLLEKERIEKNVISRKLDKVERDLESYQCSLREREARIGVLTSKYKLKEKAFIEETAKLKKEVTYLKSQLEENGKKIKLMSQKSNPEQSGRIKTNMKRKSSVSPTVFNRQSSIPPEHNHHKSQTPSRIPQPKSTCDGTRSNYKFLQVSNYV